jgi:SH3-like domain-containing protein
MAARRLLRTITISTLLVGSAALAQQSAVTVPTVQNSKYQFEGTTNADAVLVRAGPSDNYYPVARLDKGITVTVVGITFDWLKIVPPDGSFSFVAKAYVNKTSDGHGSVTRGAVNVRAGSTISPMKSAVQTKLGEGDTVEILGEQDEYYKIKPPTGAFVYVNKQFITPGRLIGENPVTSSTPTPPNEQATTMPSDVTPIETATTQEVIPHEPTTRFVVHTSDAENKFAELEEKLRSSMRQDLDKQPIGDLLAGYNSLISENDLPATLKRLAKTRITYLNARLDAQKDFAAAKEEDAKLKAHEQTMQSEQQSLQQKLAKQQMHMFAGVGTLQSSSVQEGGESLYRLVDPNSGRTLVYVHPTDAALAENIGQLVGVRGQVSEDPSLGLKIISPTGVEALNSDDMSKVTADIMPANMSAGSPSTTTQP